MAQISILGVDNVLFAVGDLVRARAFYEDRLEPVNETGAV
jgi:hypothetical protein